MMRTLPLVLILCLALFSNAQNKYTLSGVIKENGSKELLPGVSVYDTSKQNGTVSNRYGFYSLTLPEGKYKINYSFVGYDVQSFSIDLTSDKELDILLKPTVSSIGEVVVKAEKNTTTREAEKVQMSSIDIPIQQIKDIPTFLGEKDVLKTIQLMPGVQSGSEGQSGIYVRGGGPDQNLIILDDAVVYNASHLFGFFSLFNGDALKSVELIKGGFPAQYGGRLSSVIDMSMKEGNREEYGGEFGIGLISSRAVFEGPLPGSNGKGSFIVSGRRTYIDALIQPFVVAASEGSERFGYFFHDFNAKLNYDLDDNNRLYLSGYFGKDKFYYRYKITDELEKGNIGWGNSTGTLRWNHKINQKAFSNTSLVFSKFKLGLRAESEFDDDYYDLRFNSTINDITLKHDIDFYPSPKHTIKAGAMITHHRFKPNAVVVESSELPDDLENVDVTDAFENGIYISDLYQPYNRWKIQAGLRISHFYQGGQNYIKPEPRISTAYSIRSDLSAKASYALMNQYVHLLSNTGIGLPTDLWVPATKRVSPQQSEQFAAGLAKDFKEGNFSITLEGYYKKMNNILGYREGSSFLDADFDGSQVTFADWQDKVTSGKGRSYGMELFLQKKYGKFSGWIGYTLSWTWQQFDELNNGKRFWAKYDRRHDISVVGIYKFNERIKLSGAWVYGTGNAVSLQQSRYISPIYNPYGNNYPYNASIDYGDKNSYRMRNYHRLDLGVQFSKELKKGRVRTFEVSVYNAYSRSNPFFLISDVYDPDNDWTTDNETTELYQVSLFPILPSFTYSLTF